MNQVPVRLRCTNDHCKYRETMMNFNLERQGPVVHVGTFLCGECAHVLKVIAPKWLTGGANDT